MSNLSIFNFNKSPVKLLIQDETPFFNLIDVCDVFGIQNPRRVLSEMLDAKGVRHTYTLAKDNKKRKLAFISEPNLYRIIFRSDKPVAVDFQNWVFDEVLPTIRKTGSYSLTINTEQKYQIRKAVNERVHRTGEKHQAIYHKLYDQFKINSYEALPANKFDEAIDFLGGVNQIKDNYDVLVRLLGHLETVNESQQKLLQMYMYQFEDFIENISPSTHYNISSLLNKIKVNIGLALNYASTAHPTRIVTTQKQLTN